MRLKSLACLSFILLCHCGSWLTEPDLYEQELPDATVGIVYEYQFEYLDNANEVSFAVTAGAIPNGMYLSDAGVLSGAANQSGLYEFEVTLTEAVDSGYNDSFDDDIGDDDTTSSTNDAEESDAEWFTLTVLES